MSAGVVWVFVDNPVGTMAAWVYNNVMGVSNLDGVCGPEDCAGEFKCLSVGDGGRHPSGGVD